MIFLCIVKDSLGFMKCCWVVVVNSLCILKNCSFSCVCGGDGVGLLLPWQYLHLGFTLHRLSHLSCWFIFDDHHFCDIMLLLRSPLWLPATVAVLYSPPPPNQAVPSLLRVRCSLHQARLLHSQSCRRPHPALSVHDSNCQRPTGKSPSNSLVAMTSLFFYLGLGLNITWVGMQLMSNCVCVLL